MHDEMVDFPKFGHNLPQYEDWCGLMGESTTNFPQVKQTDSIIPDT